MKRRTLLHHATWTAVLPWLGACGGGSDAGEPIAPAPGLPPPSPSSGSALAELVFVSDYAPGRVDDNGRYRGGTEVSGLVAHQGKLYAAMSYWKDMPGADPSPGAQVLVKSSIGADWNVDIGFGFDFGNSEYYSTEVMASITLTTDAAGTALVNPEPLLMASPAHDPALLQSGDVWIRDDATNTWTKTLLAPAASNARVIFDHVDGVTGVHHVFAGMRDGTIYRGVYDPTAPGRVRWDPTPELRNDAGSRFVCAAVANGKVYAGSAVANSANGVVGGVYERIDGATPTWRTVYQWPVPTGNDSAAIRGLTAVPDPQGRGYDVLLAAREADGIVERIDPRANLTAPFSAVTEFNFKQYYTALWGGLGGGATLAAYNDIPSAVDPRTGERVWLIGLWVNHPQRTTPPHNASYYLVRRADGSTYEHGVVIDAANPLPAGRELRATRTIVASPFAQDAGRAAFYFAGFDAGGNLPAGSAYHNNAWIYRGSLP
jgi:hypothetical protein